MQAPMDEQTIAMEWAVWLEGRGRPRTALIQIQAQADTGIRVGFELPVAIHLIPRTSPEELVIQQRGRKRLPVTWSPVDLKQVRSPTRSPPKNPVKPAVSQRSAPRKRLFPLTPNKMDASDIPTPKKFKISPIEGSLPAKSRKIARNLNEEWDVIKNGQ